jgi:hypothetical protein
MWTLPGILLFENPCYISESLGILVWLSRMKSARMLRAGDESGLALKLAAAFFHFRLMFRKWAIPTLTGTVKMIAII